MTIYYSPSQNGFYNPVFREIYEDSGNWPEDAMAISERWHRFLLEGQVNGKIITANDYGQPVLIEEGSISNVT